MLCGWFGAVLSGRWDDTDKKECVRLRNQRWPCWQQSSCRTLISNSSSFGFFFQSDRNSNKSKDSSSKRATARSIMPTSTWVKNAALQS